MDCASIRDDMLDVLYDEADPATARRVDEHQARCAACREELAALKDVRHSLQAWSRPGAPRLSRPRAVSAWRGIAVAAALLLAVGIGFGLRGAELRFEDGRFALRLGGSDAAELRGQLGAQARRHDQEIEALKAALASGVRLKDDDVVIARVRDLIRESEARQAVAWNASMVDFAERSDARRRYDLARMSAGLSYLDGKTGQQVARTNEIVGYVLKASQQR
jgi:hypothetical protein